MKNLLLSTLLLFSYTAFSQSDSIPKSNEFDVNYFYGYNLEHNYKIGHLITGHPQGLLVSWNRKTYGQQDWSARYNYPDQGLSFIYQDMANPHIGEIFGLYGHFNFYFFKRHLMLRLAEGLVYNTTPYDPVYNFRNNAFGSHFLFSTMLILNYSYKNIYKGFGLQAGALLVHYSNGKLKSPNASVNSLLLNLGITYQLDYEKEHQYIPYQKERYSEPIHYNFALRTGVNDGGVEGMGQYPFLTVATYADKRLTHSSTIQFGTEAFFSRTLKELIKYWSVSYPELDITGNESSTRVGVFAGYQLSINKFSVFANLGYYAYYPVPIESRVYSRLGIQRELPKNFFVNFSVHAHSAIAEDAALSIGYRL